jgi:hypothetical protein
MPTCLITFLAGKETQWGVYKEPAVSPSSSCTSLKWNPMRGVLYEEPAVSPSSSWHYFHANWVRQLRHFWALAPSGHSTQSCMSVLQFKVSLYNIWKGRHREKCKLFFIDSENWDFKCALLSVLLEFTGWFHKETHSTHKNILYEVCCCAPVVENKWS